MLEPQVRSLLLDVLKPPVDYTLDFAFGTTYSLDLITLLSVPLAFMLLDQTDRRGELISDPVTLLAAIKGSADKFLIFCQAGEIKVPPPNRSLLSLLESNVIEARAPGGGAFHPKVWLLRFIAKDKPVHYRFVCATRNLTFDKCWDTSLVMEGELVQGSAGFPVNRPLVDFVVALPGFAVRTQEVPLLDRVRQMAEEVPRVQFAAPKGFEGFTFHPIGLIGKGGWPFVDRIDRLLVVSPFVADRCLQDLRRAAKDVQLVTRLDTLSLLDAESIRALSSVKVFSDEQGSTGAETLMESGTSGVDAGAAGYGVYSETSIDPPQGLHAKLYVADAGVKARIWTGSANATHAAFAQNVEFLVELIGRKRDCGIDALLASEPGEVRFVNFLVDPPTWIVPENPSLEATALEDRLRKAVRALASCSLVAQIIPLEEGWWNVQLRAKNRELLRNLGNDIVKAWPVLSRREVVGQDLRITGNPAEPLANFPKLSYDALTVFMAFRVEITDGLLWKSAEFTLVVEAEGMPPDRANRLLRKIVGNRPAFEAYLRLMLTDFHQPAVLLGGTSVPNHRDLQFEEQMSRAVTEPALFEMLVQALARDPERIDDIARVILEISSEKSADDVLPTGFAQVWEAITVARKVMLGEEQTAA